MNEEKKMWFKPKPYGWGAVPVTLEGWGVTILWTALLLALAWWNGLMQEIVPVSDKDVSFFVFEAVLSGFGFIQIIKDRVEGGLKWRWGLKK